MQPVSSANPSSPSSAWVVVPKPQPQARIRLFCFPYAGAGPVVYRAWPENLPQGVELVALHYPGRESRFRETPFNAMQPLVDTLAAELAPYTGNPFVFFGHSLGGLIAFELARRLRRAGLPQPAHLFISSRRAPHLPEPLSPIHALEDSAFTAAVQQRYGGIPDVILQDPDLLAMFLPVMKADFAIFETYQYTPEPPFDFPISVYYGTQDHGVTPQALAEWQTHSRHAVTVQPFPGDHFYLQGQRKLLLQTISNEICRYL